VFDGLLLAGCGSAAPAASSPVASAPPASAGPASATAKAAASAAASGQGALEKPHLEIAIASTAAGYMPVLVAKEGGYFAKHGLDVT